MQYAHLIYDFAGRLPRFDWILLPLIFFAIGVGVHIHYKDFVYVSANSSSERNSRIFGMILGILFASVAGIMSLMIIPPVLGEYFKAKSVYEKQKFQTIEGVVANYQPMPASGRGLERFTVEGITFEFSDSDPKDYGYSTTASHGGVIKEGLKVRIGYFDNGHKNVILKLETE